SPNIRRSRLCAGLVVEPVDGNVGACASECEGARPTDALLGASDQGAPSFEVRLHEIAPGLSVVMLVRGADFWVRVRTLPAHQRECDPACASCDAKIMAPLHKLVTIAISSSLATASACGHRWFRPPKVCAYVPRDNACTAERPCRDELMR